MSDDIDQGQYNSLKAEVAAAHVRLDSVNERMGGIETSVRDISGKIDRALSQKPSQAPLWVLGGITAVLLTIMSLLYQPIRSEVNRLEHSMRDHADGHPVWVVKLMDRIEARLSEKISTIDSRHADEHIEQEQDITELRARDERTEERIDAMSGDIVRLDTIAGERTARFKSRLDMVEKTIADKAGDRWTGSQQRVYQHQHEREHDLSDATTRGQLDYLRQEQEQSEALQHQIRGPGRSLGQLYKEQAR